MPRVAQSQPKIPMALVACIFFLNKFIMNSSSLEHVLYLVGINVTICIHIYLHELLQLMILIGILLGCMHEQIAHARIELIFEANKDSICDTSLWALPNT